MELYYVICICKKNNGHCKRIIGEIGRIMERKLEH